MSGWIGTGVSLAIVAMVALAMAPVPAAAQEAGEPAAREAPFTVLVFSRTGGFRHGSIPAGIACLRELGERQRFEVRATEDPTVFDEQGLRNVRVVVFLNTTGDILDDAQQAAFERYVRAGGGFVGIHAAADTEYDWPFYGRLVGAYFRSHPAIQPARIEVVDRKHPSTTHLAAEWRRRDEWYDYRAVPDASSVRILLRLDESTYENGAMGDDHPIAWCHTFEGGRSFYTGGGHTDESYAEPAFRQHLLGGILWAAGQADE